MGSEITVTVHPAWVFGFLAYLVGIVGWAVRVEIKLAQLMSVSTTEANKLAELIKSEERKQSIWLDIRERIVRIETKLEGKVNP